MSIGSFVWSLYALIFVSVSSEPTAEPTEEVTTLNFNDVNAKYFISQFQGDEYPIAPGTCNPLDLAEAQGFHIPICIDSENLLVNFHSDRECASAVTSSITINSTFQTGTGSYLDFNCDGVDAYGIFRTYAGSCESPFNTVTYSPVSVCTIKTLLGVITDPDDYFSTNIYCDSNNGNYGEGQYFVSTQCAVDELDFISIFQDTCAFFLNFLGTDIYSQILGCVLPEEDPLLP